MTSYPSSLVVLIPPLDTIQGERIVPFTYLSLAGRIGLGELFDERRKGRSVHRPRRRT